MTICLIGDGFTSYTMCTIVKNIIFYRYEQAGAYKSIMYASHRSIVPEC